ncbi:MAG: UDP-N-acetylglucosamine 2-epimerase (non-hydrolyzing), partial [Actinobacteria bacterium]|nr:UDP-N-acetylglucosamine 2-epimerase (non-hydrolyzing) [Actinomycetota bacterium]
RPDVLVVYGDVNSTLAGALVAAKLHIPVAHVEAGLRSGDMAMPEEINRRLTDQISDLLFATSADAVENLHVEGLSKREIHMVGNTMIDTLLKVKPRLNADSVLARLNLGTPYLVATLHRPSNVDDEVSASKAVAILKAAAEQLPVVLPLHPRGRSALKKAGLEKVSNLTVIEPLGYLDFISLVSGAKAVITDSGGIQEETTVLGVACLTLRATTERPVTISHGTNRLVNDSNFEKNLAEVLVGGASSNAIPDLWDGQSGPRIANVLRDWLLKG